MGDGSGNAFLTMKDGVPTDWGGGTLYDPQGNVVTHGTAGTIPGGTLEEELLEVVLAQVAVLELEQEGVRLQPQDQSQEL